jgi:Methylamine utilisation protein MauE
VVVRSALALALLTSAALKLAGREASSSALQTFGVPPALRTAAWAGLIAVESTLALGVIAGSSAASLAAAALCAAFAAALTIALVRGRGGAPCGCFGKRSRVTWLAVLRTILLAAGFAVVPFLPQGWPSTEGWLALGLALGFVLIAALAVAVLALAREVGLLRLRLAGESALELPDEGPPLGEQVRLIERFSPGREERFALAVFSSDGCRLCHSLEPAVAAFRHHPLVAVEVFDEARDTEVWRDLDIPGSPFAVALGRDGTVHAKGTFNSYGQLESILATAERRLVQARA